MRHADFTGPGDLRTMQDMCSRLWSPASRFHPGQLAWNRYYAPVDALRPRAGEAISFWRDRVGQVVGFGWAEGQDWLELQVDPAHPEVAEEVLDWFEEWSDAATQSVLLMEGDTAEDACHAAGFAPDETAPFFRHHLMDLSSLPPAPEVEGYRFRHVDPDEGRTRAACHAAAWSDFGTSEVTGESYEVLMSAWPYRAGLDWVAIDALGRMVASALVWLDPATGVGLVEPVGCVPEHRGRGLAGAVTLAALHALVLAGGRTALVTPRGDDGYPGPMRLYRSLGFQPGARTVTWTRSLGGLGS
ncbi:MAG: GCN5 family acetyltransferase [Intrasporangium sp.]|uniref:GNAT family N-acetyltransferase n=1 Tax=Intrasporangium sp. TaxID=1925024 RepID=UPI002649DDEE|nr:GNAT family N-acetyltransferase [Intrasporangium sp.]MDN5796026.1 GCN5 family acetyltransferase [Intrasporangium sp.]